LSDRDLANNNMDRPKLMRRFIPVTLLLASPVAMAAEGGALPAMTASTLGVLAVAIFVFAYALVIAEEFSHLRKSKPVMVAAGLIWLLVAITFTPLGYAKQVEHLVRDNLLDYAGLLLFLLSAMTFLNTMEERNIFRALRGWIVASGFSLRAIFWITGLLAFFISPFADNLTTALVMAAVVLAVAADNRKFVGVACINIVVAANAGGAFSPFGDITTLMVWQRGVVKFEEFFAIFIPSVVNWLVPAALMALTVPKRKPHAPKQRPRVKFGGYIVVGLFLSTIGLTVASHQFFHLPPFLGMMTGLGLLKVFGYIIRRQELRTGAIAGPEFNSMGVPEGFKPANKPFDIYVSMKRVEWDTLMFFYGVVLCVGGLGAFGYLAALSHALYLDIGPTGANVLVGILSAIIDNIPIMFAVLSMNPDMSLGQWLLVTLTAGVGGSLLSIGSAAGVALMGQARGVYTFFTHLRWTWAIALGYAASIYVHFLINPGMF